MKESEVAAAVTVWLLQTCLLASLLAAFHIPPRTMSAVADARVAPVLLDDALYEASVHGYFGQFTSHQVHDPAAAYREMGPRVQLSSRHGFNAALPASPQTPQPDTRWMTLRSILGSGSLAVQSSYAEFFCAPLAVGGIGGIEVSDEDEDEYAKAYVHDANVFIRFFDGRYAMFFSTCTAAGPGFWSRWFARESALSRASGGGWVSAAVPLVVRQQLTTYYWLVQNMAAKVLQAFKRGVWCRRLVVRAQRRRLVKLSLLRRPSPFPAGSWEGEGEGDLLLRRLQATPEAMWAKVLAYL